MNVEISNRTDCMLIYVHAPLVAGLRGFVWARQALCLSVSLVAGFDVMRSEAAIWRACGPGSPRVLIAAR